jgi:hypothetical protein
MVWKGGVNIYGRGRYESSKAKNEPKKKKYFTF